MALCMALGTVPAMAQSQASSGQIAGSVTDSSGAAVANATVKVTNTQTGLERTVTSDDAGLFNIVLLPPGVYTITGEASGFSTVTVTNVEVVVGRTADVKLTLGVSGVQESVTVSAGAVQVQTTRSEADAVISERQIENLPINGRRFQDFVTLTPGAQVDPRRQQISLSGQLGIHTNVNVDGVDYNQPFFGGIRGGERSNSAFTIPQESIKEFQVVSAGYTAEFGRSTGGIVNAVTKSGTNEYHGSGFFLARPKSLAKDNLFIDEIEFSLRDNQIVGPGGPLAQTDRDVSAAPTQYQWGGSFGGPIKKNKLFFFGSAEMQRLRQDREVFFPNLGGITPGPTTQEAFDFYTGLQQTYEQTNDALAILGRIDYEINSNHRMNIRYSFSDNEALNAVSNGVPLFPTLNNALSNNGTEKDRSHTVVGQVASFLTTSLVNEFRGQYSHERRPRLANEESVLVTSTFGNFGTVNFLPTTQFDWRVQLADNISWTRGTHNVKVGGEWNHVFADQTFGFNQFGRFTVGGNAAQVLDILTLSPGSGTFLNRLDAPRTGSAGSVTYDRQIGNLLASFSTNEFAIFAQDSWRIRPNFTLNYGLRWEAQYNPNPETGNDKLIDLLTSTRFPSGHVLDPTQIFDDTNNFGPRLGFAWDPGNDGKTVIRGFGGIYYSRTPLLLLAGPFNNFRKPAGDLSVRLPITPAPASADTAYEQLLLIGIDLNDFSLGNLPIITAEQIAQIAVELGLDPDIAGQQPIMMAQEYQNPKSVQAGVGVEREVVRGFTLGADFTYVHTSYLQQNRDVNLPLPIVLATDPAQRPRYTNPRPIPQLGTVQIRESTGRSLYRALTLRSKFQRSWGQFSAFYVLSSSLSDTDNEREAGGVQYADAFDTSSEYGRSNLHRRHQFTASPVFFLPWNIDFSSAIRLRSGRPFNAILNADANGDGNFNDRPFKAPGVPFERNAFDGKPVYDVDVRIQKRFQLNENHRLTFSWEIFNIFNLENIEFGLPPNSLVSSYCSSPIPADCGFLAPTNPNFLSLRENRLGNRRAGRLLTENNSGSPFQMQFGVRYQF